MKMGKELTTIPIMEVLAAYPYAGDFFNSIGLRDVDEQKSLQELVDGLQDDLCEDIGIDGPHILDQFVVFINKMKELKNTPLKLVKSVTIIGGHNKNGEKENVTIRLSPGEVVCIVGLTGAGKSRLLADIECLAQKDTPTGRQILVNDRAPNPEQRFSGEHKLVAQLSQNMNFVVDLTVAEFIAMHAESRMIEETEETVKRIWKCANELAGEQFAMDVPVTQLSGGQSRALMIADTSLLSPLPIVLIDEIENAGVDRKKALSLLVKEGKIVLMSTHDPLLALMGDRRIVIKNGGIADIIRTSGVERANLAGLERIDDKMNSLRNLLRTGGTIDFDLQKHFEFGE